MQVDVKVAAVRLVHLDMPPWLALASYRRELERVNRDMTAGILGTDVTVVKGIDEEWGLISPLKQQAERQLETAKQMFADFTASVEQEAAQLALSMFTAGEGAGMGDLWVAYLSPVAPLIGPH